MIIDCRFSILVYDTRTLNSISCEYIFGPSASKINSRNGLVLLTLRQWEQVSEGDLMDLYQQDNMEQSSTVYF